MNPLNIYIEEKAERLLHDSKCYSIPVNVNAVSDFLGIKVKAVELEEEVSGFCVINGSFIHIGFNKNDPAVRIRFTIAHELGHVLLHAKDNPVFIDKVKKFDRNVNSSTGQLQIEREANAFAAALLMPRGLLTAEINSNMNETNKSFISLLANKFGVSDQAMTIRLTNLGLIDYYAFAS